MIGQAETKCGAYLYGIISSPPAKPCAHPTLLCTGIDDARIYLISQGRLAAVVSDVPRRKFRPERRHLAAHHAVVKHLMENCTVLPVSFGVIADGADTVRRILSVNQAALDEQLQRLKGKVEMGLRVFWDVPNIFEHFVNTHAELKALRDQLFRGGREPSQDQKIELGRLFERILSEERAAHTETAVSVLSSRCAEIKQDRPRNEREVTNLACLVERDAERGFEDGVLQAAQLFDSDFRFDLNGPWPPYNFVTVELTI